MSGGSPTFKSNPNPGKLDTSFWTQKAFKKDFKKDNENSNDAAIPKKVNLYGKSFYDDKDADTSAQPTEKPKEVVYGDDPSSIVVVASGDDNKDGMEQIPGKCIERNCKCDKYVENPSKWSKGKCKTCDHPPTKHKVQWVKSRPGSPVKAQMQRQTAAVVTPKAEPRPEPEPEPEPEEPEQLENLWGEEFTDNLKECVSDTFDYDEESILPAKYLLHYLKKRVGFDFTGQKQHRDALKYVSVDLFGWKVINQYGYNI